MSTGPLSKDAASVPKHPQHRFGNTRSGRDPVTREDQILTTRTGLLLPEGLTFDAWQRAGVQISRVSDTFAWCLGDWLNFGRQRFADRYRRTVDAVGLDYQTLRNYASVSRRVPMARRRSKLSFQHHAEVAAMPELEQERWLTRAEENAWSRNQLRRQIRASRLGGGGKELMTPPVLKMAIPPARMERWQQAAARSNSQFEVWVADALDRAAEHGWHQGTSSTGSGGMADSPK